jgi:hypothetical protein
MTIRNMTHYNRWNVALLCCVAAALSPSFASAQSVGLPAPRLLTTMPMGGAAGSKFELTISGDFLDGVKALTFSDARIAAAPKVTAEGKPEANKFVVTIDAACPSGIYDARVMTRLGLSSSRAFSVGTLPEVVRTSPNTTTATAMELKVNSVCNATVAPRSVDHYVFEARRGQRVLVDCAAKGIDSKLIPVVIVADAAGNDLLVERRGGALDFSVPADGRYMIKVHELTFQGGPSYFYRLVLRELKESESIVRHPTTSTVNSFSWPPQGLAKVAATQEQEPNHTVAVAQKITLPCDVSGTFAPAADADLFEFEAKKGEEWWVEVASERFGLPTDPAIIVQHVTGSGADEKVTDVAELSDIASPVKVSSNGYAYDGPPYNAGSSDVLGKLTIAQDGRHRLKLTDLFGGTRNDPRNVYRLVIRKAEPDFALVAWALHMELRNGDRNALSKPIALRAGATMALEVVALRRDGFDGEIALTMDGLPKGVRAAGLKIPAGKSRGIMLVSSDADAADAFASAKFVGRAKIAGAEVRRPCRLASMAWPVADAWSEVPWPRLLADVPVSVTGAEPAPLTISSGKTEPIVAAPGAKVTIPLTLARRGEFNGGKMSVKFFGVGFEQAPAAEIPLTADKAEVVLDLAALKTPPGEYTIALYGGAVTKYRYAPDAVAAAEAARTDAEKSVSQVELELKKLTEAFKSAPPVKKAEVDKACKAMEAKQKVVVAALAAASEQVKRASAAAEPKGIVDIVVSEPIVVRVQPAEAK